MNAQHKHEYQYVGPEVIKCIIWHSPLQIACFCYCCSYDFLLLYFLTFFAFISCEFLVKYGINETYLNLYCIY